MPLRKQRRFWLETSARIIIPAAASVVLFTVTVFAYMIPTFEENMKARKREMICELTRSAWTLLAESEARVRTGELTTEAAQARAIERVVGMRYGPEMKDYFWINDMQPRLIAHPYRIDLVGQDVSDYADPTGKHLFLEFVKKVRENGGGYVDYMWQWKDNPRHVVPKLSYVMGFAPWGWIIGTGIYVEDVRTEIAALTRRMSIVCAAFIVVITALLSYVTWQGTWAEQRRIMAEEDVRGREEELAHMGRLSLLSELASGLAHELNQPLCVILGCGEMSLRKVTEGQGNQRETIEALQDVVAQAERAAAIIRRMRNFAARRALERGVWPVQKLIIEAVRLLEAQARRASVAVRLDFGGVNPTLYVDHIQIEQVIVNLVKNAFDAMQEIDPEERKLKITARQSSDSNVEIAVHDTGPGIPAENLDRIFTPFFTTKPDGIGIGLSLSRSIVEAHDGRLNVTPDPIRGTIFTITLPVFRKRS